MVPLAVPESFLAKLALDPSLQAAVHLSFAEFEPWLAASGMPFFPGFTDHSPRHINEVLETASSLIADETRALITAADVAVLVFATLLHDSGMHLTADGFRVLVSDERPPLVSAFDSKSWAQLWRDFLSEASRFSAQKLLEIVGDDAPLDITKIDPYNLDERQHLIAGEFVRRHHARLAHEIALIGVPGPDPSPLTLQALDADLGDLSGLIARSHNLPIRAAFGYLVERYHLRDYRGVKAPFLMAVLRIADYLQVQSERADTRLLRVKQLRSPVSRQEWEIHASIRNVSVSEHDPEAMHVRAEPKNVATFLRLRTLFTDIQRELDDSWSALGEVYGRFGELRLTLRRIHSNLDDMDRFAASVDYVPVEASLRGSEPELLQLLVGPLYGYDPTIGVRELIQNAIDAVKERDDLLLHDALPCFDDVREQDADVVVTLANIDGYRHLEVADQGVGMTLDTVLQYFLVAGASFRNSDIWKRQHEDVAGKPRLLRGGRFGIGVLSSFLIGDSVEVESRHYSEPDGKGIAFTFSMEGPAIELRRRTMPIGTRIRIPIAESTWKSLIKEESEYGIALKGPKKWAGFAWYFLATPSLRVRKVEGPREGLFDVDEVMEGKALDDIATDAGFEWVELPDPLSYEQVKWYGPRSDPPKRPGYGRVPKVTVNGIRVGDLSSYEHFRWAPSDLITHLDERYSGGFCLVTRPAIAISDPNGLAPINLQRSAINFEELGLDGALERAVCVHFISTIRDGLDRAENAASALERVRQLQSYPLINFAALSKTLPPATVWPGAAAHYDQRSTHVVEPDTSPGSTH